MLRDFIQTMFASLIALFAVGFFLVAYSYAVTAVTMGPEPRGCGLWSKTQKQTGLFLAVVSAIIGVMFAIGSFYVFVDGMP